MYDTADATITTMHVFYYGTQLLEIRDSDSYSTQQIYRDKFLFFVCDGRTAPITFRGPSMAIKGKRCGCGQSIGARNAVLIGEERPSPTKKGKIQRGVDKNLSRFGNRACMQQ